MADPIEKLADVQLRLLAADLQVQLERGTGTRPILFLLAEARKKAAKAVVLFMDTDPHDAPLIRRLQQELVIYNDMVSAAQKLLVIGREANHRITEADRDEIEEIVVDMSDDERKLHGFERRGID